MSFQTMTQAELKAFMEGLSDDQRSTLQKLLATIAVQAEAIQELSIQVQMWEGTEALMDKAISGVSLVALAAKLDNPAVAGPSLKQINGAISDMNKRIQSAKSAQQVFTTILGFATKLAPLA